MKVRPRLWNRTDPNRPRNCRSIMRGTPLGNPFVVGVDGSRSEVIELYRQHVRETPGLMERISEMDDVDLVCCCAPMPCHGDVILQLWDYMHPGH